MLRAIKESKLKKSKNKGAHNSNFDNSEKIIGYELLKVRKLQQRSQNFNFVGYHKNINTR